MVSERLAADLDAILHPFDERDVPVPGFPSGDALVAWGRSKPERELQMLLLKTLQRDRFPQQYAAMAVLRATGASIEGVRRQGRLMWQVRLPDGESRSIEPDFPPQRPGRLQVETIGEAAQELAREFRESFRSFWNAANASVKPPGSQAKDSELV